MGVASGRGASFFDGNSGKLAVTLSSLIATGTKVWLDGVEPSEIEENLAWGITGATSNPAIVSKIIDLGHFDGRIRELIQQGCTDGEIAWRLDDQLVASAQQVFLPTWERTGLERQLMQEGIKKFIEPQKALLELVAQKRASARP
jgi:hypothetical protein